MPHGVDAVRQLVNLSRDDAHPGRRAFVARTAYVAAAVTLPVWPAGQSRAAGPAESADRQASSADAEVLQSMSGTFADLADRHGGGHARTALAAYASEDVARLRSAPMSGRLRSELFTGAAQLTHLLAMMTADAGYQRAECESLPDSSLSRAQAC